MNERSFGTFSGNGAFMAGYYATVDHALGSAAGRYFGEGHRRSRYSFVTDGLNDGHVVGTSTVSQDGLWSSKEAGVVSRHLSTIDAVSLAGLALGVVLERESVEIENLMVQSVSIRAGAGSTEDLVAIPTEASVERLSQDGAFICSAVVGTMKLSLTVVTVSATEPVGPAAKCRPQFFAEHMRDRIQHISDLDIDLPAGRLRARLGALTVWKMNEYGFSGLQGANADLFSVYEAIVCLAQLAQVLAYEYDNISRDESAVFWLRRLDINLIQPWMKVGQLTDIDLQILKADSVVVRSETWRTLRLAANGQGISASADVAHILPGTAVRAS